MQNYTTQMDAARKGIVTPEMEIVAKKEYRTTEEIRQLVAEGKVAIPANKHHTCLNPEGMMKAICDAVDIPVVAIGGIHKENLLRLKGTGVNGVALVSAIFGAEDIEAECRELKALAEQL